MGRTTIDVSSVVIEDILFDGANGVIRIIDAKFDHGTGIIRFVIEGDVVPDCPESYVIITQKYRTVEIKPRD